MNPKRRRDSWAVKGWPVVVEWDDANAAGGWKEPSEYAQRGTARCQSVGWVVAETPKHLILVQSRNDVHVSDSIAIPRPWIRRRRTLK